MTLDSLEAADTIPALDGLVLDFDHYGRVVGLRVTGAVDWILAPSLLESAERAEPKMSHVFDATPGQHRAKTSGKHREGSVDLPSSGGSS